LVRGLARTAHRIPVDHTNLRKIDGNALDPVVVQHALAGVDVVIQSLGVPVSGIDRPASSIVFRGDALVVAAMKKAGTKRLICGEMSPSFPLGSTSLRQAHVNVANPRPLDWCTSLEKSGKAAGIGTKKNGAAAS
jgi:hypothetical protein